ncbi:TlpA disulfide reductase family protein [uncultured Croceitalea sp.]|uniref:TlpA family protein disulfide reductase n=1 Tax=uncultured Croceitalea sp. TaxID=1798908 RepID=UPI003305A01D
MKNLIAVVLVLTFLIVSCKKAPKDYVTFSGKIENKTADSLFIKQNNLLVKVIEVNKDGTFSDTLKVDKGVYYAYFGKELLKFYLKDGYDLNMSFDAEALKKTLTFQGMGEVPNNYYAKSARLLEQFNLSELKKLNQEDYDAKIASMLKKRQALLEQANGLDSLVLAEDDGSYKSIIKFYNDFHHTALVKRTLKGKDSPKFQDYENFAGGTMSLDDLKGKYVYLDLWGTFCAPCIKEIPFLKKIEKAYHGKNIAFVSISYDAPKNYEKWRNMVTEKELGGIQLYANGDEKFHVEGYGVTGLPRFILIDPQGKVVDPDAPKPSSEKLITLFNTLNI